MSHCWCARCGQSFTITRELVGKRMKCQGCGYLQRVPEPLEAPVEVRAENIDLLVVDPVRVRRNEERVSRSGWHHPFTREDSRLQGFSVALLLISTADLLMTYTLLRTSNTFYESNPIAQWVFHRWNMAGMVVFKFALVAFIIGLAEIIERHRPRLGKAVLLLGCLATAYAFIHGLRLYLGHGGLPPVGLE